MDLQQLRYFVSAAELLNMTEAAKVHYIGQSSLSKQISNLEKELGVQLFVRDKRSLVLTEAGKILLEEAIEILRKVEQAKQRVLHHAAGNKGTLSIGYIGSIERNLLPKCVQTFGMHFPQVYINIARAPSGVIKDQLLSRNLDIGLIFLNPKEENPDLDWEIIAPAKLKAILPHHHPLAQKERLSISELAHEVFVFPSRGTFIYDFLLMMCVENGFYPHISSCETDSEGLIPLVESGIGISFLAATTMGVTKDRVKVVDLIEEYTLNLAVVWNKKNYNPVVPLFIRLFKEKIKPL